MLCKVCLSCREFSGQSCISPQRFGHSLSGMCKQEAKHLLHQLAEKVLHRLLKGMNGMQRVQWAVWD